MAPPTPPARSSAKNLERGLGLSFLLYAMCGGAATVFDWSSFYLVNYVLKWHYLVAVFISFSLGTVVNFTANKFITFRNYYKNIPLQVGIYLLGAGSALLLTVLLMFVMVEYLRLAAMYARISATGITFFYNFIFHKIFTFGALR